MADQFAWNRLAELTDTYGQRISGSDNLKRAITWAVDAMKRDGLENVHTERVMIPRWVRGQESLEMIEPPHHVLPMLGLGGSVATPPAGIEADVIVVANGDELARRSGDVKGKIVLFTNEENGLRGGNGYRDAHAKEAANHVFAVESDSGVFAPTRLGFTTHRPTRSIGSSRRRSRARRPRLPRLPRLSTSSPTCLRHCRSRAGRHDRDLADNGRRHRREGAGARESFLTLHS